MNWQHKVEEKLRRQIQKGIPINEDMLSSMVEEGQLSPEAMDRLLPEIVQPPSDLKKNVLTLRVTDDVIKNLDSLVSLSIAQSRSEAAYMLIIEGQKARAELFEQIKKSSEEIENIKKQLELSVTNFGR